ncbi:MAG: DUF1080 domain-containing protein [Acidobacteriota bacterium]
MKCRIMVFFFLCLGTAVGLVAQVPLNTLTPEEKAAGWQLLFDGRSLAGWRAYNKTAQIGSGWKVEDGLLRKVAGERGGDIVTEESFNDFEFAWEWRLEPGGNNGVKYLISESRTSAPGPEYQMIDELAEKLKDLPPLQRTAAFYDVLPAAEDKPLKPASEWNSSRLIVNGNHVEHWLNGKKVLEYELGSEVVRAGIAASKFNKFPDFGTKVRGPIMLTDYRDGVWFRNLKIRQLK